MPINQATRQQSLLLSEDSAGCTGADRSGGTCQAFLDSPAQGLQQPPALQPLASCPRLVLLNLQGNPLGQAVGISEHLAQLLPSVSSILT